jgi:uncharacterized membrane protein (DUF2068 family)
MNHPMVKGSTGSLGWPMGKEKGKRDKWVVLIGITKVIKGALLILVAFGALKLIHKDAAEQITRWLNSLYVDPHSHFFQKMLGKISGLDTKKLIWASAGTFLYAGQVLTEGIGLLMRKRWAEYFTVFITGSFIPFEIYELVKEFNAFKVVVTIANAAIVVYLVWRLKTNKK